MVNGGQDCTQAARFIVHEKAYKKFEDKFLERLKTVRMGDPLMRATDLGPLVSQKQREKVEKYVEIGEDEGAKLALGGKRPKDKAFAKGWYYEPTAFVDTVGPCASPGRKSSDRWSTSRSSPTKTKRSRRRTIRCTACTRPSGRRTSSGRTVPRTRSASVPWRSTITYRS